MKRIAVLACAFALASGLLAGCAGQASSGAASASADSSAASAATSALAASESGSAPSATSSVDLADGTYVLDVETDSSMVNVVASQLDVEGGQMTVTMSLNGEGFSRVFLGSAEDAANAADADIYDYTLNDEGKYTFTFPIEALDEDTDVALFGQRRDTWYDHVLVFSLEQ